MAATSFEIRVCQNPDCGLRYPLSNRNSFGDRCPVCLSQTSVAVEKQFDLNTTVGHSTNPEVADMRVLLDNVRSGWNVGSILRSADGFDFCHAYLCGITPTPDTSEVRKTALGAEKCVTWSVHKDAVELINELKKNEVQIFVLEQTSDSIPINQAMHLQTYLKPMVLVVGNEVTGVDPGIIEIADTVAHIPMRGQKRSFNVAVAYAVAAQIMRCESDIHEKPGQQAL